MVNPTYDHMKGILLQEFSKLIGEPLLTVGEKDGKLYHLEDTDHVAKEILNITPETYKIINMKEDRVINLTYERIW